MDKDTAHDIVQAAQWPDSGLSAQSIAELRESPEYYEKALLLIPDVMVQLSRAVHLSHSLELKAPLVVWEIQKCQATLRELTQVPTESCPRCRGEQEVVSVFEFRDMDGSWTGYTVLACGHNGPEACDSGFSLGPDHDPYGVRCELDRSCHARDERGRIVHRGANPLPAPGQEIILWTGGGFCAGDPLPRSIIGYESEAQ